MNNIYDIEEDWYLIVAGIKATFGDVDIMNMRAKDFRNIYLPNIKPETTFGNILRIMTDDKKNLNDAEKNLRREREKKFNKDKSIGTAEDLKSFARMAFGKKGGK